MAASGRTGLGAMPICVKSVRPRREAGRACEWMESAAPLAGGATERVCREAKAQDGVLGKSRSRRDRALRLRIGG